MIFLIEENDDGMIFSGVFCFCFSRSNVSFKQKQVSVYSLSMGI